MSLLSESVRRKVATATTAVLLASTTLSFVPAACLGISADAPRSDVTAADMAHATHDMSHGVPEASVVPDPHHDTDSNDCDPCPALILDCCAVDKSVAKDASAYVNTTRESDRHVSGSMTPMLLSSLPYIHPGGSPPTLATAPVVMPTGLPLGPIISSRSQLGVYLI